MSQQETKNDWIWDKLPNFVNRLGLPTVLVIVVVAWLSGYLQFSPLDAIATAQAAHHRETMIVLQELVAVSRRSVAILERFDTRDQLVVCSRIQDPDLKRFCLAQLQVQHPDGPSSLAVPSPKPTGVPQGR